MNKEKCGYLSIEGYSNLFDTINTTIMRNYFKPKDLLLLAFPVLLFAVSCTNNKDEPTGTIISTPKPQALLTPGYLDTLYINRQAFDTIANAKIVFSFVFPKEDSLTLHGWRLRGGGKDFDSLPKFKLANAKKSNESYGYGTYFGNIILSPDVYAKIKVALNDATIRNVVFCPYKQGDNIAYKVAVSKDEMGIMSVIADVSTLPDAELNPSPPKNY